MPSKQALLALSAVLGFRFGGMFGRQALSLVPGAPAVNDDVAGAIGAVVTFMVMKRIL